MTIPQHIQDAIGEDAKRRFPNWPKDGPDIYHSNDVSDFQQESFMSGAEYGYSLALEWIRELENWKESAMRELNNIDLQAVGKELGIKLGLSISSNILPEIKRVKELLHEVWNKQYPHPEAVQDLWEKFKRVNNL